MGVEREGGRGRREREWGCRCGEELGSSRSGGCVGVSAGMGVGGRYSKGCLCVCVGGGG